LTAAVDRLKDNLRDAATEVTSLRVVTTTAVAEAVTGIHSAKSLFEQILSGTDSELLVILNKVVHLKTILATTPTSWVTAHALMNAQIDLHRLRNALTHAFRRQFGQQNMSFLDEVLSEAMGPQA